MFLRVRWLLVTAASLTTLLAGAQDTQQQSNPRVVLGPNAQVVLGPNAQVVPEGGTAPRSRATGGAGASLTPIQLQILEATRKTHEATVEQAREIAKATAEQNKAALEALKGLAQASIDQNKRALDDAQAVSVKAIEAATTAINSAKANTENIKDVIFVTTGIIGVIVAILGIFGFKTIDDFRKQLDGVLDDVRVAGDNAIAKLELEARQSADILYSTLSARLEETAKKAESIVQDLEVTVAAVKVRVNTIENTFPKAAAIAIDISMFLNLYERLLDRDAPQPPDPAMVRELLKRLDVIGKSAQELDDQRTVSWVEGHRALVYYFAGEFVNALTHQIPATAFWTKGEPKFWPIEETTLFDRQRNLACMAGKVYETTADQEALALAVKTLGEMETYISAEQAAMMLAEDEGDLKAVFALYPERKAALEAKTSS